MGVAGGEPRAAARGVVSEEEEKVLAGELRPPPPAQQKEVEAQRVNRGGLEGPTGRFQGVACWLYRKLLLPAAGLRVGCRGEEGSWWLGNSLSEALRGRDRALPLPLPSGVSSQRAALLPPAAGELAAALPDPTLLGLHEPRPAALLLGTAAPEDAGGARQRRVGEWTPR